MRLYSLAHSLLKARFQLHLPYVQSHAIYKTLTISITSEFILFFSARKTEEKHDTGVYPYPMIQCARFKLFAVHCGSNKNLKIK
jgi:hypothetical protein